MKLTDLLIRCGYRRVFAETLACFIEEQGKEISSREIEQKAGLRQPETNVALAQLLEKKWIVKSSEKADAERKGRPVYLYKLLPIEQLYVAIEKEIDASINEKTTLKKELRSAMIPVKTPAPVESSVKKEQQLSLTNQ